MTTKKLERRELIRRTGIAGALVFAASHSHLATGQNCQATPAQTPGPFTPPRQRDDEDNDLTQVRGQEGTASGEVIVLRGQVLGADCLPRAGAIVEIWQASDSGRYDHPRDDNPAPLDPNFQYWGRHTTDANGQYWFKTIKPGLYPGRTRHIHLRVMVEGERSLTTQVYFKGEPRNARDGIYRSLSAAERALVTVDLEANQNEPYPTGVLNIVLGTNGTPRL